MIKNTTPTFPFEVISRHGVAEVFLNPSTNQRSLLASMGFQPGDVVQKFEAGTVQSFPTYLTVQTGIDTHITLKPDFLQYINHSCDPNIFFDTVAMELVCIRSIQPGDELTFFYPSTEWEMSQPFLCNCQSAGCLQLINGAAHLDASTLKNYRLNDFILKRLNQLPKE
jgi:hypothetical protein